MLGEYQTLHITTNTSSLKHGCGGIMLWGCYAAGGPGRLEKTWENAFWQQAQFASITKRNTASQKMYFLARQSPETSSDSYTKMVCRQQGGCCEVLESKHRPHSEREFMTGLKKNSSQLISTQPNTAGPVLQGRVQENCSVQMYKPDYPIRLHALITAKGVSTNTDLKGMNIYVITYSDLIFLLVIIVQKSVFIFKLKGLFVFFVKKA